jgi:hypothetical protein
MEKKAYIAMGFLEIDKNPITSVNVDARIIEFLRNDAILDDITPEA